MIDNASTDSTAQIIENNFSVVSLIKSTKNLGYSAGNNLGIKSAYGEYIVVLNPDTKFDEKLLSEFIKPMEKDLKIDPSISKILMYQSRTIINTCGNVAHISGFISVMGWIL